MIRAVVFDVGETLVRDDQYWTAWADWLDVPRHTLSALVGAVVALGRDNSEALRLLRPGIDVAAEREAMNAADRGERLEEADLYPDARPGLAALRQAGFRVCVAGNQTVRAARLLRDLDLPADAVATSGEWGAAKPDLAFFTHVTELAQAPPGEILYVGDHPANDITPARTAGLRTCLIRRGPWGHLWAEQHHPPPHLRVDSILELPRLLTEA